MLSQSLWINYGQRLSIIFHHISLTHSYRHPKNVFAPSTQSSESQFDQYITRHLRHFIMPSPCSGFLEISLRNTRINKRMAHLIDLFILQSRLYNSFDREIHIYSFVISANSVPFESNYAATSDHSTERTKVAQKIEKLEWSTEWIGVIIMHGIE